MGLPQTQNAAVKHGDGHEATAPVKQISVSQPGPGQILVKINWTGLCASDKSLIHDEWASQGIKIMDHGIAGHEGAGEVVAVHDDVKDLWQIGDRAGIKWTARCVSCACVFEFFRKKEGSLRFVQCLPEVRVLYQWSG